MLFTSLILSALAATRANAIRACGVAEPTEEQLAAARQFGAKEDSSRLAPGSYGFKPKIEIKVYFHIVAQSASASGGYLSNSTIGQQLAVMNTAFSPSRVSFKLAGIDWTIDPSWSADKSELTMKKTLRKGSYSDLNLYFINSSQYFGKCYFPRETMVGSDDFYYDGCTILAATVPGGYETNYDLGYTAVHEVGHWLGLFHTFQGISCEGAGDMVADTPAELSAADGCPVGRDTCASLGADPIHNYMDYTYDTCYEEFTPGQGARMHTSWEAYRASYA